MSKTLLAQIGTAVLAICGFIAGMSDSLGNQIPQFFPQGYREYISLAFLLASYVVHNYGASNRPPQPPAPPSAK